MENDIFSSLAQYDFTPVNPNVCVGVWNNYAVTLRRFSGRSFYVYFAVRFGKAPRGMKKTLKTAIKESGAKHDGAVVQVMPNWVAFSFAFFKDENPAERFSDRMNAYTGALRGAGAAPANSCAITGAANPDSLCYLEDQKFYGYQPVFSTAVRQSGYEAQTKAEDNEINGSYLSGIVGAILGTLVGIALNVATILLVDRIYAVLFALVPICAMFGYKLLRGRTNKVAVAVVCVLSVLAVPAMAFFTMAFEITQEFDYKLGDALELVGEHFFDADVMKEIGPGMLKLLLFMGLGLLIAWSYVRNSLNSTKVQAAKAQMESLRKNPNVV